MRRAGLSRIFLKMILLSFLFSILKLILRGFLQLAFSQTGSQRLSWSAADATIYEGDEVGGQVAF